jgi:exopolysaccharide biosynthesis polyprenyl glycosylphosphotransferase
MAALLVYSIVYVVMYATVSRRLAFLILSFFFVGGLTIRIFANWASLRISRGLLVVGGRGLFESFLDAQRQGLLSEYRLLGAPSLDSSGPDRMRPTEGGLQPVTDIVVGAEAARDPAVMQWMMPWLQRGCRVTDEAVFYEKATGQILVDEITPAWFLFADLKGHCDEQATLKRFVDLLLAALGLCLTLPVWPLLALAIKLGDGGPVVYSQIRVGQHGRVFTLYKFRTMRTNAENGRSLWSCANDPRVTRVGRWLRRSRLDELPQLYNVLKGDMSIVGPRPERPDFVAELSTAIPYYSQRHLVKPGITGWAQISFRYGSSVEDAKRKLQFDLYYLKHMSFELDLVILFRTMGTFLRGSC